MQTQWSTGANDGQRSDGVGGGPTPAGSEVADVLGAGEAAGEVTATPISADHVAAAPVVESAAGGAGGDDVERKAPSDGTEGEEEAHRSAVDAVDGLLDEVELALARLDDGTYGRCEECGALIDDARLADSPIERTCGACVIGGPGVADTVTGPPGVLDVPRPPVAPVGLTAATGHHGG
jgi:hypothetical protein